MMKHEKPLPFRIKSLNNQIKRLLERSAIKKNVANLTGMQCGILGFLGENVKRDVFQKDIEAEFNIRRSTATGMLQLLERDGYIERIGVPGDARLKKIVMTDKAMELDQKAKQNILMIQKKLTKGISEEELELFYQVLTKMSENIKE